MIHVNWLLITGLCLTSETSRCYNFDVQISKTPSDTKMPCKKGLWCIRISCIYCISNVAVDPFSGSIYMKRYNVLFLLHLPTITHLTEIKISTPCDYTWIREWINLLNSLSFCIPSTCLWCPDASTEKRQAQDTISRFSDVLFRQRSPDYVDYIIRIWNS